ncbi:hypothetical protein [Gemmobacter caeni]|uniref:hypothetical protein n=1 Tax=Gemmobacter caeni TaxID=589035 RepID=UPI00119FBC63|nr:hypothetical protein [Gemmobacter caeni]
MFDSLLAYFIKPLVESIGEAEIARIPTPAGFGRQHRMQVRAARKPAVILRETRQIRRAAARAKAKGRAA